MAYDVYVCCDNCGIDPLAWTNITISYAKAERIARKNGWTVTRNGAWYCPDCAKEMHINRKKQNKNASIGDNTSAIQVKDVFSILADEKGEEQ